MTVNLDAIDLSTIDDPSLRAQLEATIAENHQLRRYCGLMQREAQFKSHFMARISHELRSPLSGIIGSHQLVLEDLCEDREEELDFVQQANDAALRLTEMLDALLLVSRLEAGRKSPKIEPIAIAKLFGKIREPIALEAANASLGFQLKTSEPHAEMSADLTILSAIAIDLLELALDLGRERRVGITLSAHAEPDRVEFQLDSALRPEDLSDELDLLDRHIASTLSRPVRTDIASLSLTPSLRLTLDTLLLECLGGGCMLPEPHPLEGDKVGSRLRFWLPLA